MNDTIFAPATAPGRSAVAVLRISGPRAAEALQATAGRLPPPRRASYRRLRSLDGERLDEALVLWMPGPASFTGEDSVELQVHGGSAVTAALVEQLAALGLRPAEAGEFTRRAFQNGRLDLAQAEAVGDLIEAETGGQRRQALAQLEGALSRRYQSWRDRLLDALALLEAEVDFPDEHLPEEVGRAATPILVGVLGEMAAAAGDLQGERVREGFRVALLGAPNVGKSSVLNALTGRATAIVTDIPGTTRDIVEAPLILAGHAVVLADTAGLREAGDSIEAEGVRRARVLADTADLRIGIMDASRPETMVEAVAHLKPGDLLAVNKQDLAAATAQSPPEKVDVIATCALTEGGVAALSARIAERLTKHMSAEFPAVTRSRHRNLLLEAVARLKATTANGRDVPVELLSEDVRLALRSLERVTGRINPEGVLDRVFASFCIGK